MNWAMKKARRASTVTVRALLSGNARYASPPFSRGFTWGSAEIANLLIDLDDMARQPVGKGPEAERLYLGSIALGRAEPGAGRLVIDGQQRLAALVLILACLRDRLPKGDGQRIQRLLIGHPWQGAAFSRVQLRGFEHDWFTKQILSPGATLRLPDEAPEGGPERLLASARFLARSLVGKETPELRHLAGALLDATAVVLVQAIDERDETRLYGALKGRARVDLTPEPAPAHEAMA